MISIIKLIEKVCIFEVISEVDSDLDSIKSGSEEIVSNKRRGRKIKAESLGDTSKNKEIKESGKIKTF